METRVCEIRQICMKNSKTKSTIKAHKQHKRCFSGAFIVNFRGVGIEDPVKHVRWSFFAIQGTKAKIFNKFSNGF